MIDERPPIGDLWREWLLGPQQIVFSLLDTEGRPLGELTATGTSELETDDSDDSDSDQLDDGEEYVSFELAPSGFPGTRRGKDMNVSALRQVNENWGSALADLSCLRDAYVRRTGVAAITVADLCRIGQIAIAMPAWFFRRDLPIPARAAAQFKISQGIVMTTRTLMANGCGDQLLDATSLHAAAEQHGKLVSGERACAGPPRLIIELFQVALAGGIPSAHPSTDDFLGDVDAFVEYAIGAMLLHSLWSAIQGPVALAWRAAADAAGSATTLLAEALRPFASAAPARNGIIIPTPEHVASAREHALRELALFGLDGSSVPDAAPVPSERQVDLLAARIASADPGLVDDAYRATARALFAIEYLVERTRPLIERLMRGLQHPLGCAAGAARSLYEGAGIVPELFPVAGLRGMGIEPPWTPDDQTSSAD